MPRKPTKSLVSSSASSTASLPSFLSDPLPKLIVFDLDYTLWPFWIDTHVSPPLKPTSSHASATDKHGEEYSLFADVPRILQLLPTKLAVASRTSAPNLARDLLKMIYLLPVVDEGSKPRRLMDVFTGGVEIYPSSKIRHFEALHKKTGIAYEDMLFFDDESRNQEVERLGVTMRLVRDGVCWEEVERGVEDWRRRRGFHRDAGTG